MKQKLIVLGSIVFVVVIAGGAVLFFRKPRTPTHTNPSNDTNTQTNNPNSQPPTTTVFDKTQFSTTVPDSIWFVNNKRTGLPIAYVPADLVTPAVPLRLGATEEQMRFRKIAQVDLEALFAAGKTAGLQLQFGSGYRSASYQKVLYDGYVTSMGKAEADRSSARPGHSEHQTGLALDFTRIDGKCHLQACFADLAEGSWLAQHAYEYGFILRYTTEKEQITGYMSEPWHYRYVGKALAAEMRNTGIKTLEEFFGLPAAPDYID